ncbi:MAG TPA: L-lactate permease [Caldilineae bacterium]|nr:L-lactate permease [Caldilineae bacterium]
MPMLSVTLASFLLALSPIVIVLALMVGARWSGTRSGFVGWCISLILAAGAFGAGPRLLWYSQLKSLLLSFFVLYIIWFALALFHVVNEAGALRVISAGVARLTSDRTMQLLILSWVFASFLQGVTGFGVPVAVVAPLLVGLGFPAMSSVVAASIGHAWAITFGSIASSFYALMAITGLDGHVLAPWTTFYLGIACLFSGLIPAYLYRGWSTLRHSLLAVSLIGGVMATVQYLMAVHGLWSLASFTAGLVGLGVAAALARLPLYHGSASERSAGSQDNASPSMGLPAALSAYIVLLIVVVIAQLVPPFPDLLNRVRITMSFPETRTGLGWVNPAGPGRAISVFGHAGALILYTCIISFMLYRRWGCYEPGAAGRIIRRTVRGALRSSWAVLFLVGMAMAMAESGMTYELALGLSQAMGPVLPFIAPFIGMVGGFVTGTNTNSNVIFGPLQQQTAQVLGHNVLIILAAQNVGGAVGSVISPAKVIVGCSTAGLAGREGEVMRLNLAYGVFIMAFMGALTAALVALI